MKQKKMPRILRLLDRKGFMVSVLFTTGEARVIDFEAFVKNVVKPSPGKLAYRLIHEKGAFDSIVFEDGNLYWPALYLDSTDFDGKPVRHSLVFNPSMLYEASVPDEQWQLDIAGLIKKNRLALGLSQAELAHRSGTDRHHISRIENNRTDIELSTLVRIVEAGLGKRLKIDVT